MKKIKIITAISILIGVTVAVVMASTKEEVNPYGRFFVGEGVEVEMAEFTEKNKEGLRDVLLKVTGTNAFNAGIDGKTLRYQAVHGGTGIDYKRDGETRMLTRNPYGNWYSVMEVLVDGKTITVQEDVTHSKAVRPLNLLTASEEEN
jgi:hypothetical protein